MKCENCNHYTYEFKEKMYHSSYVESSTNIDGFILRLTPVCQYQGCHCDSPRKDSVRQFREAMEVFR